jgi:hypothetical protein
MIEFDYSMANHALDFSRDLFPKNLKALNG